MVLQEVTNVKMYQCRVQVKNSSLKNSTVHKTKDFNHFHDHRRFSRSIINENPYQEHH